MSLSTASATFPGSVHGVVVHARIAVLGCLLGLEPSVHAGVRHVVLVPLRELVARQWSGAARTVRRDAESLVHKALLPHLAQSPPHRLDVIRRQSPVGV